MLIALKSEIQRVESQTKTLEFDLQCRLEDFDKQIDDTRGKLDTLRF